MSRILRILAAVLVLAMLTGAESCTSTNRPPWERQCVGDDCMTATIVTNGTGPYELTIHVIEAGSTKFERRGPLPIASGEYTATVTYASGWVLEITVEIGGHATDTFSCEITDGPDNREFKRVNGSVACLLMTRQ